MVGRILFISVFLFPLFFSSLCPRMVKVSFLSILCPLVLSFDHTDITTVVVLTLVVSCLFPYVCHCPCPPLSVSGSL